MSDWIDNLARLAEAATPGPWEARRDDLNDEVTVVHDQERVSYVAGVGVYGMPRVMADAEFIAAANPATILRLIAENRRLTDTENGWRHDRSEWEAERDALAARLAAVGALADETEQAGDPLLRLDLLRAALTEVTTDTTKETP